MRQTPDLSEVPIFKHLDEDERAEFEELSEPVRFEAGQRIFEEGAPEERLYVITSGTVEVYKSVLPGRRQRLAPRPSRLRPWSARWVSSPSPEPPRASKRQRWSRRKALLGTGSSKCSTPTPPQPASSSTRSAVPSPNVWPRPTRPSPRSSSASRTPPGDQKI